jgi:hypothetical protein
MTRGPSAAEIREWMDLLATYQPVHAGVRLHRRCWRRHVALHGEEQAAGIVGCGKSQSLMGSLSGQGDGPGRAGHLALAGPRSAGGGCNTRFT